MFVVVNFAKKFKKKSLWERFSKNFFFEFFKKRSFCCCREQTFFSNSVPTCVENIGYFMFPEPPTTMNQKKN